MSNVIFIAKDKTGTGTTPWVAIRKPNTLRTYQVSLSGTGSLVIEASNDGVNAVPLTAAITASAGYEDSSPWAYVRANISANSANISVVLGERE